MEDNLIDVVYERIKLDKVKLESKELERNKVDSFELSAFWTEYGTAVQALSNEVTKISFLCGNEPFPKSSYVASMMQDMLQYYNMMRDIYLVLPGDVGEVVFKAVTDSVLNIISSLLAIVQSFNDLTENGAKERLILMGTFMDACNAVESLPKNNLQATLKVIEEEITLAADAQEELTTTLNEDWVTMSEVGDCDNSDLWTNPERDLATKSIGLVKVTHVCLQKLCNAVRDFGSYSTPQNCAQLDLTAHVVQKVSPALDDFVSELYHPIDFASTLENARKLVEVLHSLLSSVKGRHYEEGINKDLINKLLQFIRHNHSKLDPDATNPLPELSCLSFNN